MCLGAAAPAVEHHPDAVLPSRQSLNGCRRGGCRAGAGLVGDRRVAVDDARVALRQRAPRASDRLRRLVPAADAAALAPAVGYGRLDLAAQLAQAVRQPLGRQARALGDHAAADVDADGGRDDRPHVGITEPTVAPNPRCTSGTPPRASGRREPRHVQQLARRPEGHPARPRARARRLYRDLLVARFESAHPLRHTNRPRRGSAGASARRPGSRRACGRCSGRPR
jgi:hypothetical protein